MRLKQIEALQYLEKIKCYYDKKPPAKTPKVVSALLDVPEAFLVFFYETLDKIDLMRLTKSPGGRLKEMEFNQSSTVICFASKNRDMVPFGYLCQGKGIDWKTEEEGTLYFPGRATSEKQLCAQRLEFFKGRAEELGLPYVLGVLSVQEFAKIVCVEMCKVGGLEVVDEEGRVVPLPTKKEKVDPFAEFRGHPLVLGKVIELQKRIVALEKEMAEEEDQNKKKGQWYETEYAKALNGTRTVRRSKSFVVGYETKEMTSTSSMGAWYSDTLHEDVRYREEPIYETHYWTEPDFPARPEKVEVKKRQNPVKIAECKTLIESYKRDLSACEQRLREVQQKEQERARLERERYEIDLRLRRL